MDPVKTITSLLKIGFKVVAAAVVLGLVTALVWSGTYNSFTNGSYVDAAIGVITLLLMAIGVLWVLYRRIDLDVSLPSTGTLSESE